MSTVHSYAMLPIGLGAYYSGLTHWAFVPIYTALNAHFIYCGHLWMRDHSFKAARKACILHTRTCRMLIHMIKHMLLHTRMHNSYTHAYCTFSYIYLAHAHSCNMHILLAFSFVNVSFFIGVFWLADFPIGDDCGDDCVQAQPHRRGSAAVARVASERARSHSISE